MGSVIIYLQYESRIQSEVTIWATRLDSATYEQLVAATERDNRHALDMIVYETIFRDNLNFASFMNQDELAHYLSKEVRDQSCKIANLTVPTSCRKKDSDRVVGIIPLEHEGKKLGFLLKESTIDRIIPLWTRAFYRNLALILIAAFSIDLLGIVLYFRSTLNKDFRSLLSVLKALENNPTDALPQPVFRVSEFDRVCRAISGVLSSQLKLKEEKTRLEAEASRAELACQVAHDIRSPLTALYMLMGDGNGIPEAHRALARSAVTRIQEIANNLLLQNPSSTKKQVAEPELLAAHRPDKEPASEQLLSNLVESLVSEKRMQYRGRPGVKISATLDPSSYGIFAFVNPLGFKSLLSNLINNAAEAIPKNGTVEVSIETSNGEVRLVVQDNGIGIPPEVLMNLMRRGATYQKKGGIGLGLYYAKIDVESWGGRIEVQSKCHVGTTVILHLRKAPVPFWFVPELNLVAGSTVVVLDDDESIHRVWEKRLEDATGKGKAVELMAFSTADALKSWYSAESKRRRMVLYLIDQNLSDPNVNGIEIIRTLNIENQAILVTHESDDVALVQECSQSGVRLLPKILAAFIPLRMAAR